MDDKNPHDENGVKPQRPSAQHGELMNAERRLRDIISTVPGVVWEAWGRPDGSAQSIDFVSDVGMVGMDGYEFVRRVRSLGPEAGARFRPPCS